MTTSAINTEVVPLSTSFTYVGNPEMTFFTKSAPKRHSPFARVHTKTIFNGAVNYGSTATVTIPTGPDLIGPTSVEWTIPAMQLAWSGGVPSFDTTVALTLAPSFGYAALQYVDINIGPNRIDRAYGRWMAIWLQLTSSDSDRRRVDKLIGAYDPTDPYTALFTPQGLVLDNLAVSNTWVDPQAPVASTTTAYISSRTIRVPLQFWFCTAPELAIPLVMLNVPVTLTVMFTPLTSLAYLTITTPVSALSTVSATLSIYGTSNGNTITSSLTPLQTAETADIVNYTTAALTVLPIINPAIIYETYYLGTAERTMYIANPKEYTINLSQYYPPTLLTTPNVSVPVSFTQHVKELIWVVSALPYNTDMLQSMLFNNYGLYTAPGNKLYTNMHVIGNSIQSTLPPYTKPTSTYCAGIQQPVIACSIMFEGNERVMQLDGNFYNTFTVGESHSGYATPGVYAYTFSLFPEDTYQFSGEVNCNTFNNIVFNLQLNPVMFSATNNGSNPTAADYIPVTSRGYYFTCFATSLNTLRVTAGQAGLAYAQ